MTKETTSCRRPKPVLAERPLLTSAESDDVANLFKILSNPTRLRILHALARKQELCVTDLAALVNMKAQAVSNQLQRLVDRKMLACRRDGTHSYYRIADPCVAELLDSGICLLEDTNSPCGASC
ncbi:ArsR/SmtB family transcription factor [Massilia putida]|uniref:ArsR/SmtB family transcription factor n=1 Tax=Massilia putida TaxID=1141883 RepID=UPI0009510410|nr:metalloregulator ArsR/SmtB family transcription factor [Massilia putida]